LFYGAEVWQMVQKYGKWCRSMANGAEVWQMVQKYGKWCRIMANGAEVWQIPNREINKMLSTETDVLRSARKSMMERIKNEHMKEIMGVKGKPEIIHVDLIVKKRLQWYGHVKRMPEERIPKLIMEWIPLERRKRGRPRKTWIKRIQAAMTTRNLETDQWRDREEWFLVSGRR